MTDDDLARLLAQDAGELLTTLRSRSALTGKELGLAGDHLANMHIMTILRSERPADALLSEEEIDNPARSHARRVWIVDPLDGTREYGEGRSDWAVHVALAIDGVATVGAVSLPAHNQIFSTGTALPLPPPRTPRRLLVSRSRPPAQAHKVANAMGAEMVPMGSAGAKAMAILRGEGDIYVHAGGQYEWDNCAPVAVAQAAGLHVSRIDGSPLRYNQCDPHLPDILICHPLDAAEILAVLRAEIS